MKKFLIELLKISPLSIVLFYFSYTCIGQPVNKAIINNVYTENYIHKINTPSYNSDKVRKILLEFNEMGDNRAVRFSPNVLNRPITIEELDSLELLPEILRDKNDRTFTVGVAYTGLTGCKIFLLKGLDYATLRRTVIHEYLHCMGYLEHSNDPNDLMSGLDSYVTEANIKGYAQRLKRKLRWKTLKN